MGERKEQVMGQLLFIFYFIVLTVCAGLILLNVGV
jgi:hypothetical protein